MLSSLKKWVQDVTVDLAPPSPPSAPPQPSTSSPSLLSSSLKSGPAHHYYYSTTPSNDQQQYNERLSTTSSSTMGLSRPISMDSVRSSKTIPTSVPPPLASPVELDLSHLNREEQEHIANVLRRARAVDEQQSTVSPVIVSSIQSPPVSIVSAPLSPSISSSPSSTTSSFNTEKPENYEQNDKNDNNDVNEICEDEELPLPSPESILTSIYRCQVCNKKQQQGNTTICLQCQENEEVARLTQNNTGPLTSIRKSSSPIPMEFNKHEDDKIYDNIMRIDQELIKQNSPTHEYAYHISHHNTKKINDNQNKKNQDQEEKQQSQTSIVESKLPTTSLETSLSKKTRTNNLTEIDENDFFYQGPSPYVTEIDNNLVSDHIEESSIPSYKIDEYVEDDDNNERDHVKELEQTIANLSRHFPVSSQEINNNEINSNVTKLQQPSILSVNNIDIDSILEMEIESPSTDENYIQSSSSNHPTTISSQHSHNIPITIPILINNRRGSLSRSSGIRENLTDLLTTTKKQTIESYPSDHRPLQRTGSTHSKRMIPIHRQKRNLPSVPLILDNLQLRRTNSESRFCLPAVSLPIQISNSNVDDESDLLEIDINDPMGSMKKTARSKTESEIINNNNYDINYYRKSFNTTTNQSPSIDKLSFPKMQIKQLRDQTTNTSPISNLNSTIKIKKKVKKKGSLSPNNTNSHHINPAYSNGQMTPTVTSPTVTNPPTVLLSSPSPTNNTSRPKLQKSTSTEMSYPFPVSKLILNRDSLNVSQRDGADLGFRITGGHSILNCPEVAACIEHIDKHHRNYNILKNAVQEGDEVLEVGGISLRGKSALFVQNLMNSIQDEFEIIVRSQHVIPSVSLSIEIHKPEKRIPNIQTNNNLGVSSNTSLIVDSNISRRHSMDTSQCSPTHSSTNTVVKSQSTIMPLPRNDSNDTSEQLLAPTITRKKSVSSKERLFSVESLHRTSSIKSAEHLKKVATQQSDINRSHSGTYNLPEQERQHSIKRDVQKSTSLSVTTPEQKISNDDTTNSSQPIQRRRIYEHRNSLLPNDPGLNGAGSNSCIDRRNSNESDESDNLSQYFRSSPSRKSSLMATNDVSNILNTNISHEQTKNITPIDDNNTDRTIDASNRLQSFIKSTDEHRLSRESTGGNLINLNKTDEKKLSNLGSFKFLKKKTKSVDFSNQPNEIRENDYVGDIELQIGHNSEREQLVIRIIRAKNLLAKDTNGYSDPFVKVYLLPGRDQENKRRTKHISKNLNPIWDHTVIYGNMHREELQYKMLEFTVWDYDRFKANDFIGQITIDLKDANVIDDKPHWYRLQALRSREEATNRGSSPRLFKMTSVDSTASSVSTSNKNTVNMQSRVNQRK
ncbi:unnamed protein product [Rotaria sp. Silwood1]|nr:unnamed protein product [Rotaria sp. Silwood1]CAF0960688.1 unnamed protein product [Rotaria sp. Silwood1]CAF3361316.1 unnamed protein product [Rotaria sp. Silwood1]CAF3367339.1 unnamed protein product [Rotaria sp. Silwood1]CAF4633087.1 unnamed protein product [Rotaria sp. Silwood1]